MWQDEKTEITQLEFAKFNLKKINITGFGILKDWLARANSEDYRNVKSMEH